MPINDTKIVDQFTIKIQLDLRDSVLAKITLNLREEIEIRYCRITFNRSGELWFQPPKLMIPEAKNKPACFGVIDQADFKRLEDRVLKEFHKEIEKRIEDGVIKQNALETLKNKYLSRYEDIVIPDDINNIF